MIYLIVSLILLLLLVNVWLVGWVFLPLRQLSKTVSQLTNQDLSHLSQITPSTPEINQLRRALVGMANHIAREQVKQRAYSDALTIGQETERQRLARELHDDTIQSLIAIGQKIDLTSYWMQSSPTQAQTMLRAARDHINESTLNLRNLITDLRPPALEELGLLPTLAIWGERLINLKIHIHSEGQVHRLPEAQELTLFRCAQEAISNAQRHGQATEVKIQVNYQPYGTSLTLQDNGQGFIIPTHWQDLLTQYHYGLWGIHERVTRLQGRMTVTSTLGLGTQMEIFIPNAAITLPENKVLDPVCHAQLEPHQVYGSLIYQGEWFYFCCPVCQASFELEPTAYLNV